MKKIICLLSIIFILIPCAVGLTSCGNSNRPVYQGMTIKKRSRTSLSAESLELTFCASDSKEGTNGEEAPDDNSTVTEELDKLDKDIEKIVDIDVDTDDEVGYYVKQGETFIIEIRLSNPKNFEIQSFTLNGEKYASYMFKEGSTMELLRLEVTAPTKPGYTEYTIDAIKYIDGTDIKDVDMSSAEKTVKAGIAHKNPPTPVIWSQTVTDTSASLAIILPEHNALTEDSRPTVYLSDGEKIIDTKPLQTGENIIVFNDLERAKAYQYAIAASIDMIDGKGVHTEWLLKKAFNAIPSSVYDASVDQAKPDVGIFTIYAIHAEQTSISFALEKLQGNGAVTKISLYDTQTGELAAQADADCRSFNDLMSGHKYDLRVDYTHHFADQEIADSITFTGIKTLSFTKPTLEMGALTATDTKITGSYTLTDPDKVCKSITVELYKGSTLVDTNEEGKISFENLKSNTKYKVVVICKYDMNNGTGEKVLDEDASITTLSTVTFDSFSILNTSEVVTGDTITLQINVNNPDKVHCDTVTVNGIEYDVDFLTAETNKVLCEIVNNGQLGCGNTTLKIEKIKYINGLVLTPEQSNTASLFIYGDIKVKSFDSVVLKNGEYIKKDYIFPSDKAYLMLTVDNPTGYSINSLTVSGTVFSNLQKLDGECYLIELKKDMYSTGSFSLTLSQIKYSLKTYKKTLSCNTECRSYALKSDTVHYITSVNDLMNMSQIGAYYELKNDIDLSGVNWQPKEFDGVFNGASHKIKNLTLVGTLTNGSEGYGLFSKSCGVITDLHMEGVDFTVIHEITDTGFYTVFGFGAISGSAENLVMSGCSLDKTSALSVISLNSGNTCLGGLIGKTKNCFISDCTNYAAIIGRDNVGGIVGYSDNNSTNVFVNCTNHGYITGGRLVGGIASMAYSFTNCVNYGTVTGSEGVGGIAYEASIFLRCINHGQISGNNTVGGIAGAGSSFTYCVNYGTVAGNRNAETDKMYDVGGVAGSGNEFTNCLNCGDISGYKHVAGIVGESYGQLYSVKNCVSYGILTADNLKDEIIGNYYGYQLGEIAINCYSFTDTDRLNSKDFYITTLGWDASVWELDGLDFENGKYPTLK